MYSKVPNFIPLNPVNNNTKNYVPCLGIKSWWGARFSAPVHTGPVAHPASNTMGTGSFPGVKQPGHGVDHPPHLAPRLKK